MTIHFTSNKIFWLVFLVTATLLFHAFGAHFPYFFEIGCLCYVLTIVIFASFKQLTRHRKIIVAVGLLLFSMIDYQILSLVFYDIVHDGLIVLVFGLLELIIAICCIKRIEISLALFLSLVIQYSI